MKFKTSCTLIGCFLFANLAHADIMKASIKIDKYYAAKCENYTGTWQGFINDPTDLIGNKDIWPIVINLAYQQPYIIGTTKTINPIQNYGQKLWAKCTNGVLTDIFWSNQKPNCGGLSEEGLLVSKNVLIVKLHWENAMTGTDFLAVLQRKNDVAPKLEKVDVNSILTNVKSCH